MTVCNRTTANFINLKKAEKVAFNLEHTGGAMRCRRKFDRDHCSSCITKKESDLPLAVLNPSHEAEAECDRASERSLS